MSMPQKRSMWPGHTDQRVDWHNGGTLVIFIFLGIFFYYSSYVLYTQNQGALPPQMNQFLTPEIFNLIWGVIVGLYVFGAYFTFINVSEEARFSIYIFLFTALILIYSWMYLIIVTKDRNWAIAAHVGLLIVSIAFLIMAWKHSTVAAFMLIWPIIWLIIAFFLY